ncbi:RNA polymerase sigma factor, sigma-70 family [Desulfosporosinus orientis DSM 765]|uniref:RNA polymerase sigma factor, sigma-70 family n=1 Tax=Desulfosporosinus orientis (strain ATCC 19365 / DSM 765 / NCIMB 8382 / VKM B-1628 / Singapore I) TaxID=768706 RepID=G7W6U8_DESOD|nr:RNA polymerase sigma factor [Desulfosporosinus orientis]AET69230.1 RNA polymerase sigma factor, sigma-70 family [Desulfosporosinus orientis DSM 765]
MYDFNHESELERMYEDYFSKIYNYIFCRLLHKEQTEEIVGEIFLKVISHLNSYESGKASFNTWIFTIARNVLIDFYRKNRTVTSIDDEAFPEQALTVDFDEQCRLIENDDWRELYKALSSLNERQRDVIALKYYESFNNREIARITGINESTVSTLCVRAIKKMRALINVS